MTAGAIRAPFIMPLRPPIPGVPKNNIDTKTKIEIRSETPQVDIFFTVNGTKPDYTSTTKRNSSTYLYKSPFRLPGGKQIVKAIAVDRDRVRESNVVTKQFEVDIVQDDEPLAPSGSDTYGYVDEIDTSLPTALSKDAREAARLYIRKVLRDDAWGDNRREGSASPPRNGKRVTVQEPLIGDSSDFLSRDRGQSRFLQSRMGPQEQLRASDAVANARAMPADESGQSRRQPPETATQAMRIQRETDFLKCMYCFAPRPADPYARFCNACGQAVPPLPQSRLPPPEAGQMGMCVHCRSLVPFNVPTCLVCEMPMGPQNQPQASQRLRDRLLCSVCGTANPTSLDSCVTCEARLAEKARPIHVEESAPPLPVGGTAAAFDGGPRMLSCTQCGRVNNADARFCDWCGAKPQPALSKLICPKCSSHNHPYARFCATCGLMMEPPARQTAAGGTTSAQWMPLSLALTQNSSEQARGAADTPMWAKFRSTPPSNTVATQTVGIFFPSSAQLRQRGDEEESRRRVEQDMRDRAPLLTAVSPGRGYWRKQVDHVIAHLKAYAANDAEFRTLIGEPRMGKLLTAEVHEDGYELNLGLTFALKEYKDPYRGAPVNASQYLSALTQGRSMELSSYRSDDMDSLMSTGRNRSKKKKTVKKSNKERETTSVQERALLREIGKNGEGRSNEVQALVDEGADPNCKNKDGVPVLIVAVRNRHKEAIPALVQCGADVNVKGPEKGNAPLHEAVMMGLDGEDVLTALLGCGASPKRKNDRGDTPYDLAVRTKCDPLIKRLAAKMGQSQLDRMLKPQHTENEDTF